MGLGKTIEILSLIHMNRSIDNSQSTSYLVNSHATLIVCPLNLIAQWKEEVARCFSQSVMKATFFYGDERESTHRHFFSRNTSPMIVITTYGTLSSEYDSHKRKSESPLYCTRWNR
jgi:DNA repair protein RAD5